MPPDRLAALRTQRALVAQHLAWLDAEINTADPAAPAAAAPTVAPLAAVQLTEVVAETPPPLAAISLADNAAGAPPATPPADIPTPLSPEAERIAAANARAAAILEQYAATDRFNPETTRRGCMLFATAVFLFITAAVLAAYLFFYREGGSGGMR